MRREFSKVVRVAAIKRAMVDDVIRCEACHGVAKRPEIDHITPDAMGGQPTLENARVLCQACHRAKTDKDVGTIAKAKRREANHLGASRPKRPIQSRGFEKVVKVQMIDKSSFPPLPKSRLYRDK